MGPTPPRQPSTPRSSSGSQKRHRGSGVSSPATPTPIVRAKRQRPPHRVASPISCPGHGGSDSGSDGHDDSDAGGQRQSDTSTHRQEAPLTGDTTPPPKSDPAATSAASPAVPGGEGNPSYTRAENHQRSVSAPATIATLQDSISESSIHANIARILRKGIGGDTKAAKAAKAAKGQSSEEKVGYNYIFVCERAEASSSHRVIYKVGQSEDPETRANILKRRCGFASVKHVAHSQLPPIRLYQLAETLMHAELASYRYYEPCRCGEKHIELYRVDDVETLLACQRRWYAFCKSEPFGDDLKLRWRWDQRLTAKMKQGVAAGCGHQGIAEAWEVFVFPTPGEQLKSEVGILGELRPCRWRCATLTQAVIIHGTSSSLWMGQLWLLFVFLCLLYDFVRPRESWFFICPLKPSSDCMESKESRPGSGKRHAYRRNSD